MNYAPDTAPLTDIDFGILMRQNRNDNRRLQNARADTAYGNAATIDYMLSDGIANTVRQIINVTAGRPLESWDVV